MLKIGLPCYLNTLPYRIGLKNRAELVLDVPVQINQQFKEGKLDLALISSIEAEGYSLLPFGIAAEKEVLSVNLYVKRDLSSLDSVTIGLTDESAASVALLKVLCFHFWKVTPTFERTLTAIQPSLGVGLGQLNKLMCPSGTSLPEEESPSFQVGVLQRMQQKSYDAFLLIGDRALQNQTIPNYQTLDLAKCWHEATSLPFVFAIFALKKEREGLKELIEEALTLGEKELPGDRYFKLLKYRLGERELEAFHLFHKLCACLKNSSTALPKNMKEAISSSPSVSTLTGIENSSKTSVIEKSS